MGGQGADLSAGESAAGLLALSDRITPEDAGTFFRYDGSLHPW
jgi:hypothetical protein